jgi:lipopolysaccharide/colanic/teichoic acid biosynthesis glycosyltransferase
VSRLSEIWTSHCQSEAPGDVHPLLVPDRRARAIDCAARRMLDVVVAALALLVLSPLLVLISVTVVLESPGPVLYRADRVGRNGRPLRLLKFRKMPTGASGLPLTIDGDRRLTSIGGFLSRTRLDELPQLWQVLTGEISLVGPRPEDPAFVDERAGDYAAILRVRPGLTGLSQLAFADECSILSRTDPIADYLERVLPQKCALDRLYVRRVSLVTNLRVLAWTPVPLLLRRSVSVDRATGAIHLRRRCATVNSRPVAVGDLTPARAPRRPTRRRGDAARSSYDRTAARSQSARRNAPSPEARPPRSGTR